MFPKEWLEGITGQGKFALGHPIKALLTDSSWQAHLIEYANQ